MMGWYDASIERNIHAHSLIDGELIQGHFVHPQKIQEHQIVQSEESRRLDHFCGAAAHDGRGEEGNGDLVDPDSLKKEKL